jgi:hypothetical protein
MANIRASLSGIKIGDTFETTVHFLDVDTSLATDVAVKIPRNDDLPLSAIAQQAIASARNLLRHIVEG